MSDAPFVFVVRGERFSLDRPEVDGVYSRAIESTLPARNLHSKLKEMLREGGGEMIVDDNAIRSELIACLAADEQERGELTERQRALREALDEPILPLPESSDL